MKIRFYDIKIALLLFINEVMLKEYIKTYKDFVLHYPTMEKGENKIM